MLKYVDEVFCGLYIYMYYCVFVFCSFIPLLVFLCNRMQPSKNYFIDCPEYSGFKNTFLKVFLILLLLFCMGSSLIASVV
jgi:hypothetical protein